MGDGGDTGNGRGGFWSGVASFARSGGRGARSSRGSAPDDPDVAPDGPVAVRVDDLRKSYGDAVVLRGVTFDVLRGKVNVLIGASGSGKTVLTRQLIRLERPDSGRILVDGMDIVPLDEVALAPVRKRFGMVFQMSALFDSMSVFDNVAFPLREHTKLGRGEVRNKVEAALDSLGILHSAKRWPAQLSGGMQKRVAVARSIVLEPEILIYDEPTTGLDPITSRTVDDLIVETAERHGVTSFVITHDMASVFRIADRVNYLYKGFIEVSAPPRKFLETDNAMVREFLDASGVGTEAALGDR
ncbi:MAG TPA: ATP-binding cassette domain-containing protein [Polyangiaceae bacterium LLY-WYZ-14_1]|jgi:phospholipid/cholesterol/gamma-HCH transport system ATP-binding protein|nr:ATP-binding cassette domain-containing protein [Polyangiaceae bacterium LLY-WYZ-14_1]